jgi:hypothetical protein
MSDFIQDMKDATEGFNQWANTNAVLDEDFRIIDTDLQKHYDNRNLLFEILLKILEQPDESLLDNWQRVCDQALELLDHLNGAIPSRATENALSGIGLKDFAEGEKKVWQQCRVGTSATMAELITKIEKADDEMTEKLMEDLKNANSDGTAVNELSRQVFSTLPDKVRDTTLLVVQTAAVKVVSMIPLLGKTVAPYANKLGDEFRQTIALMADLKARKIAYKKILLENSNKIEEAKEKMDEKWIQQLVDTGCEFADSLHGVGSTGDYRASDWETFGKEVRERLKRRAEPVIEKSKNLFETVHDAYLEGLTGAYVAIGGDKDAFPEFRKKLDAQIVEMFEEFKKDEELLSGLHGPTKDQALADLRDVEANLNDRIKDLREALDNDDSEYDSLR